MKVILDDFAEYLQENGYKVVAITWPRGGEPMALCRKVGDGDVLADGQESPQIGDACSASRAAIGPQS